MAAGGLFRTGSRRLHHSLFGPRHQFWVACPLDALFSGLTVLIGIDVVTLLSGRLFSLRLERMFSYVGVVADTGYLPGNFTARLAPSNLEAIAGDLLSDIQVRLRLPN